MSDAVNKAIEAAVAAGLSREQAEQIARAARPDRELEGGDPPVGEVDGRARSSFESVGWEMEPAALATALHLLGADDGQVDELVTESASRRGVPANAPRYIVVPDWDEFQHYRDRDPIWIKTYTRLLADDAYVSLTGHRRAVLHGLWLEYAMSGSCLRVDVKSIGRRLGLVVKMTDLEALNHAGFIEFALAPRKHTASPEKRREETPISPSGTTVEKPRRGTAATAPPAEPLSCPVCGITRPGQRALDEHLANVHDQAAA